MATSDTINVGHGSKICLIVTELKHAAKHERPYEYFYCTLCKECTTGNIKHILCLTQIWSQPKAYIFF